MTLVFDRRPALGDAPGAHALICGISEYRHLSGGGGEETRYSLGLSQLDSPSRTAAALHRWLVEHADDLAAPLATLRLLLAPSRRERAEPGFDDHGADLPTLDSFLRAAAEWRNDASAHRDGMTVLYIAGHGYILSRSDQLVLLHDYGEPIGSILHNAVNVGSMFQGMAPSSLVPGIARTQLYFIDTGQPMPEGSSSLPPEFLASHATQVFDLPFEGLDDRVAMVFSPAAGEPAFGRPGGLSLFGEALIECLDGAAAEQIEGEEWAVTTLGLIEAVRAGVRQRSERFDVRQEVVVGGLLGHALVVRHAAKPDVRLSIQLPPGATEPAEIMLRDSALQPVGEGVTLEPTKQAVLSVPAGLYLLEVSRAGTTHMLPVSALPPSQELVLDAVGP